MNSWTKISTTPWVCNNSYTSKLNNVDHPLYVYLYVYVSICHKNVETLEAPAHFPQNLRIICKWHTSWDECDEWSWYRIYKFQVHYLLQPFSGTHRELKKKMCKSVGCSKTKEIWSIKELSNCKQHFDRKNYMYCMYVLETYLAKDY